MNSVYAVDLKLGDVFTWNFRPDITFDVVFIVVSAPRRVEGLKITFLAHHSRFSKVYWMTFWQGEDLRVFE